MTGREIAALTAALLIASIATDIIREPGPFAAASRSDEASALIDRVFDLRNRVYENEGVLVAGHRTREDLLRQRAELKVVCEFSEHDLEVIRAALRLVVQDFGSKIEDMYPFCGAGEWHLQTADFSNLQSQMNSSWLT